MDLSFSRIDKLFITDPFTGHSHASIITGNLEAKRLWSNANRILVENNFQSLKVTVKLLSHVQLFAATGTVAYQAPQSMGFSRKEYCWGLPFPSPGDLPQPGIETGSPAL